MRLIRITGLVASVAVSVVSACDRPPEYGVSVYSTDTLPATFTVTLTDSLALALRSEGFRAMPDKSLVLSTPAQMLVHSGAGSARIVGLGGKRIAVQPLGVSDSTADTTTVEGNVVLLVRPPGKRLVTLKVEKP